MYKGPLQGSAALIGLLTAIAAVAGLMPPILVLDGNAQASAGVPLVAPLVFDNGGHPITAIVFSLDLDTARLDFDPSDADLDGIPDVVSLPAGVPSLVVVEFDETDSDGELDVLLANLSGAPLPQGVILEVELVPQQGGVLASRIGFSLDPPASFGDDQGQDIEGLIEVLGQELFADGFESGGTTAWSQVAP